MKDQSHGDKLLQSSAPTRRRETFVRPSPYMSSLRTLISAAMKLSISSRVL